jgi:hypothetical protein
MYVRFLSKKLKQSSLEREWRRLWDRPVLKCMLMIQDVKLWTKSSYLMVGPKGGIL